MPIGLRRASVPPLPRCRSNLLSVPTVLRLPDLEHAKAAVLNSLTSLDAQRGYRHAIDEFVDWYCSEPRLALNRIVRLGASDAQPIAGSEDAANPFWSPDNRYVAFFVPGKLKKADISGASVTDICPSGSFGMGGAWSQRGVIIFAAFGQGLRKVADSGGAPEPIPGAELSSDGISQLWPSFLPDGKHFLYVDWRYSTHEGHDNGLWIGSLDGEKAQRLPLSATNAHYSL
jgi:WD40-like Beta Propeller Repeat